MTLTTLAIISAVQVVVGLGVVRAKTTLLNHSIEVLGYKQRTKTPKSVYFASMFLMAVLFVVPFIGVIFILFALFTSEDELINKNIKSKTYIKADEDTETHE